MKPKQYICALIVTLAVILALISAQTATNRVQTLSNTIIDLKGNFEARTKAIIKIEQGHIRTIESLRAQLSTLSAEISSLRQKLDSKQDKADKGEPRGTRRVMEVTAYDLSVESCGKLPNHPEYGITASGEPVREWYSVAAGPELPFGTKIFIPYFAEMPNNGMFTVQDRGSAVKNGCIDVYMEDNAACWEFGRRELEVWVME
jgi:3D (Asp-Asp-Asp) domain-containing protein